MFSFLDLVLLPIILKFPVVAKLTFYCLRQIQIFVKCFEQNSNFVMLLHRYLIKCFHQYLTNGRTTLVNINGADLKSDSRHQKNLVLFSSMKAL